MSGARVVLVATYLTFVVVGVVAATQGHLEPLIGTVICAPLFGLYFSWLRDL